MMKELTDLEICKRIAEIEGVKAFMYSHIVFGDVLCREMALSNLAPQPYNPLTDDALCFRLMDKYKVDIEFFSDCVSGYIGGSCKGETIDKNTNKVVLLTIIDVHG